MTYWFKAFNATIFLQFLHLLLLWPGSNYRTRLEYTVFVVVLENPLGVIGAEFWQTAKIKNNCAVM